MLMPAMKSSAVMLWSVQGGNNNTYCHDSELNWFNWEQAGQDETGYARFFRCLVNLRSALSSHLHSLSSPTAQSCIHLLQLVPLHQPICLISYVHDCIP